MEVGESWLCRIHFPSWHKLTGYPLSSFKNFPDSKIAFQNQFIGALTPPQKKMCNFKGIIKRMFLNFHLN